MNQHDNNGGKTPPPFTTAWITIWMQTVLQSILKIMNGFDKPTPPGSIGGGGSPGGAHGIDVDGTSNWRGATYTIPPIQPRRSIVSYINTGMYKVEQMRRSAALAKQYQGTLQTIKLTQQAIKGVPRRNRYMFKGYSDVLDDARRRVRLLYDQLRTNETHLKKYDPHAIEEEIRGLEKSLKSVESEAKRREVEMHVRSRRELLTGLTSFSERIENLASQLGTIAAAVDLNHMRIVSIVSHTTSGAEADSLAYRMEEATEQLTLLEESLRELAE